MKKYLFLVFALLMSLFSACAGPPPEPTPTPSPIPPTATPLPPTPTPEPPSAWRDSWILYVGDEQEESVSEFEVTGNSLSSSFTMSNGDEIVIDAVIAEDEKSATGTWSSSSSGSGTLIMHLSEDGTQIIGNHSGFVPLCAAKADTSMPEPCGLNWSGEWQVWLGPDQYNSTVNYVQEGTTVTGQAKSAQGYRYDFKGTVNEDGSIATGTWSAAILGGDFEVYMSEDMLQFSGNLDGKYPICGARWGAPKPEVCQFPE